MDAESLVQEALACRPDLRAVEYAHAAACDRARLARYDYLNVWGALPDINSDGEKGFEAGPGLRFAVPIFNQNQGAIARATAEAERLGRQYGRLQDTVARDVRLAHTQLLRSQEQLALWRDEIIPQAEAAVTSARKALEEDAVSLLLVMETTRQLLNARQSELEAEADVRRSLAELERSVGRGIGESLATVDVAEEVVEPELQAQRMA
jgi:cobalt-zinc-cadmium efflux system outer membrane protein